MIELLSLINQKKITSGQECRQVLPISSEINNNALTLTASRMPLDASALPILNHPFKIWSFRSKFADKPFNKTSNQLLA